MKILIVDDNEERCKKLIYKFSLTDKYTYMDIKVCETADKGRQLCKNNKFDLLILDVCLPKKNGYKASQDEGLKFLEDLHSLNKYLLPTKIIGITANIQFIEKYRNKFMEYTYIVYEAPVNSNKWIQQIIDNTIQIVNSNIKNESILKEKVLISIHGIRTFGSWQYTLTELIEDNSTSIKHYPFQYNFFDTVSFIFPLTRYIKAKRLIEKIDFIIKSNEDKQIYLVAHSFGTYILSKLIENSEFKNKIELVILSGSVLSSNYNIIKKFSSKVNKVINDCGINDKVLLVNRIFVWGLSDAGRKGFYGINNENFINRYYKGGHSLYFNKNRSNKSFMEENWLPYLLQDKDLKVIDERESSNWKLDIIEPLITIVSISFFLFILYIIYYFIIK